MKPESVASRLKSLRVRAGLSVRKLADAMGRPPSSYVHYETEARMKGAFLPPDFAIDLADVLERHGIARREVMDLATAPEVLTNAGFAEDDARPFETRNPRAREDLEAAIRYLAPGAKHPTPWRAARDCMQFGILCGDLLVVEIGTPPNDGAVCLASFANEQTGEVHHALRQVIRGKPIAPLGRNDEYSDLSAAVLGEVVAAMRPAGSS